MFKHVLAFGSISFMISSCGGGGGSAPVVLSCDMSKDSVRFMCVDVQSNEAPVLSPTDKEAACAQIKDQIIATNPTGFDGLAVNVINLCSTSNVVKSCSKSTDGADVVLSFYNMPLEVAEDACSNIN